MSRWSKRDIRRLREQMIAQRRSQDEIASEIRAQAGVSMLMAYRLAWGLSQPELVARFLKQAPEAPMDQPLLSRLEAFPAPGARAPLATQIITLAEVFGTSPLRLLTPEALDRLDHHEGAVLKRCDTATTIRPHRPNETPDHSGPQPQQWPPTQNLERQVQMAARRALRFATGVEGSNIGPETIEQLRDEVARLAQAYPQRPLPELLGDLAELQDVTFNLLEGKQRPQESTDLYLLAGVLSGMLAKASHDLGNPHSALTQARTAYVCAENIDHAGLRAWTAGLRSMISYWAGRAGDAVHYAQQGASAAAVTRGTASVWLPAQEARSWAILGDAEQCRAAINRAQDARLATEFDELDELGGIMTFPLPRQLYYAADASVWLPGAEEQAERESVAAIAAYQEADPADRSFSDEAGAHADLALARTALSDVEGAAEALEPLLALPVDQRIEGVVNSAMRVHRLLADTRLQGQAARSLQQQIETYARTPAAAALPPGR